MLDESTQIKEEKIIDNNFVYILYTHMYEESKMFGIRVKNLAKNQQNYFNSITNVESVAKTFYNIIVNNIVYPEHLQDVLYELMVRNAEV